MNPSKEEQAKLARLSLLERLKTIQEDDKLLTGLAWLLREMEEIEIESLCAPGISSEESHRCRGRVGALRDFKGQFEALWKEAHGGG